MRKETFEKTYEKIVKRSRATSPFSRAEVREMDQLIRDAESGKIRTISMSQARKIVAKNDERRMR